MEDHQRQQPQSSSSFKPLVSRLDHIDFIMKHLEGKHSFPKRGSSSSSSSGAERQHMTLDSAVREAYFKGSLFDRVASLEHRLFQLCLEMESSSSSSGTGTGTGTSSQTFEEMCSSHQATKAGFSRLSLPIFTNNPIINPETLNNPPNQVNNRGDQYQLHISNSEVIQAKSEEMRHGRKNPNFLKKKLKKSKPNKEEMKLKSAGHRKSSSFWPHLKLLGC